MLEQGESVTVFKNQPIAKQTIDRGFVMQKAVRAASDALNRFCCAAREPRTALGPPQARRVLAAINPVLLRRQAEPEPARHRLRRLLPLTTEPAKASNKASNKAPNLTS